MERLPTPAPQVAPTVTSAPPAPAPVGLGAAQLLALQRRAGNAAVVSLTARLAPPAATVGGEVVHRKALSAAEVLAAVEKVPFLRDRLAEPLQFEKENRLQTRDKNAPAIRDHVQAVLDQYATNLSADDPVTDQAMALATVMSAVADVLALNVLNDPALAPQIAADLLRVYEPELRKAMSKGEQRTDTMKLATALVADDPLRLFLHDELRFEDAEDRIRIMATDAGRTPTAMFTLLRQRFEIDMAARTKAGIKKREDTKGAYNVSKATGEMTVAWFTSLFGDVDRAAWTDGTDGPTLEYTPETTKRLDQLAAALAAAPSQRQPGKRRGGLSEKQSQHFDEVEASDFMRANTVDPKGRSLLEQVGDELAEILGVSVEEGRKTAHLVHEGIAILPLTITVRGDDWFGEITKEAQPTKLKDETDFQYKPGSSRTATTEKADLYGKEGVDGTIRHFGEFDRASSDQDRTGNYKRFRGWKDQLTTGNLGMTDAELPAFAAVNPTMGSASTEGHVRDPAGPEEGKGVYGKSSYGDVHFVLDMARLAGRVLYTASDHGEPRLDRFLAFADLVLGGASRTGLRDTKNDKLVLHVVNAVVLGAGAKKVSISNQGFEAQIFGSLNMVDDVARVIVSTSASPAAQFNLSVYELLFKRPVEYASLPGRSTVEHEGMTFGANKAPFVTALQQRLQQVP